MKLMLSSTSYKKGALFVLLPILALIPALSLPQQAFAADEAVRPSADEVSQYKQNNVIRAVERCIQNFSWHNVSIKDIDRPDWGGERGHNVGHTIDPSDGNFRCDVDVPNLVIKYILPNSSYIDAYCNLGGKPTRPPRDNPNMGCKQYKESGQTGDMHIPRESADAAASHLRRNAKKTLSDEALAYVELFTTLESICGMQYREGNTTGGDTVIPVPIVTSGGIVKSQLFYIPDRFKRIRVGSITTGNQPTKFGEEGSERSCLDVSLLMQDTAPAYAAVVSQKIGDTRKKNSSNKASAAGEKLYPTLCPVSEHTVDGAVDNESLSDCQKKVREAWTKCSAVRQGPFPPGDTSQGKPTDNEIFECLKKAFPGKASALTLDSVKAALAADNAVQEATPDINTTPGDAPESNASSCAVEGGFGWIICPLMNTMADISDQAFGIIKKYLEIKTGFLDPNSGVLTAWEIFRNFANAAFIIAFLVIIYSQVTGAGISSYGIKRMLPRLIISAVLVNMSYLISQLAVDATQIAGVSLKGLLDAISTNANLPEWNGIVSEILKGDAGAATAALAFGGVAALALLAISVPVLGATLLAILLTVIILIGRHAAIVILTAVAPIAFVAYLLPNTEALFRRWLKMFWGLLLVYPIISLLYGGGALAGRIIMSAGAGELFMSITALGVSIIPLIMTPKLLQGALNATGELGAKLNGTAGKLNASLSGATKDSRIGKYMKHREHKRNLRQAAIEAGVYKPKGIGDKLLMRGVRSGWNRRLNNASGQFGSAVAARGVSAMNELRGEDVKYTEALLREKFLPGEEIDGAAAELRAALTKGDVAKARAATRILTTAGTPGRKKLRETVQEFEEVHSQTQQGREMMANSMAIVGVRDEVNAANMKANDAVMAKWAVSQSGTYVERLKNSAGTYEGLTAVELAGQANDIVEHSVNRNLISADQAKEVLQSQQARSVANQQKIAAFERRAGRSGVTPPRNNENQGPPTPRPPRTPLPPTQNN